jgi:hypothetical protein
MRTTARCNHAPLWLQMDAGLTDGRSAELLHHHVRDLTHAATRVSADAVPAKSLRPAVNRLAAGSPEGVSDHVGTRGATTDG